jgi:hypothetical protein
MRLASWSLPLVLAALAPIITPSPSSAQGLLIAEFVAGPARDWDGSGTFSSRDDEWIELYNAGDLALDLSGHWVTDSDSIPRFAPTGILDSHQRIVITGKMSVDWERATGHPVFGLSLGNTGDAVMLWRASGTDTVLVDSYTYRSHEAAADRAVGRLGDSGAWALFDGLNPYTGTTPPMGTGCSPTFGGAAECGVTPARPMTWGDLKRRYR